jgi:hypothetical protein
LTKEEMERASLSDSITAALNGTMLSSNTTTINEDNSSSTPSQIIETKGTTMTPTISSTTVQVEIITDTSTESQTTSTLSSSTSTETPETVKPTEPIPTMQETVQIFQVSNNNFGLLGTNAPLGTLGGVIGEALKLAQVSISVFGSQLLGGLIGTTYVIGNATRLVGVGR